MKLQYKLHLMISLVVIAVVIFISIVISFHTKITMQTNMSISTNDMAYTISQRNDISSYLATKSKKEEIQKLLLPLMENTVYQYIIVMDMDGIQYSYPYKSGLYKPYKNGGEETVLILGDSYTSTDTNELISAIRAFHPIYHDGEQVGAVLVGLLTDTIQKVNKVNVKSMQMALGISVIFGILVAYLFALNIKKSIFNLEPKEIAILLTQRDLIFNSLERGVIAVDEKSEIILHNPKADDILNINTSITQISLSDISNNIHELYQKVIDSRENLVNEIILLDNNMKAMVSICIIYNHANDIFGAVISIEDLTMVRELAEELTGSKAMVESLRAQNHEFMNKLQVLSGLIQLEKYDTALDFIDEQTHIKANVDALISDQVDDDKIAGLLLAKYEIIVEKKIEFIIDSTSYVKGLPMGVLADDICTVIGNILDNSMEAVMNSETRIIRFKIMSDIENLELIITNSGPLIGDDNIYDKGYSTKGENRGYGLSNVMKIVESFDGKIYYRNDKEVSWHVRV